MKIRNTRNLKEDMFYLQDGRTYFAVKMTPDLFGSKLTGKAHKPDLNWCCATVPYIY